MLQLLRPSEKVTTELVNCDCYNVSMVRASCNNSCIVTRSGTLQWSPGAGAVNNYKRAEHSNTLFLIL
jgi:hypothetical protein